MNIAADVSKWAQEAVNQVAKAFRNESDNEIEITVTVSVPEGERCNGCGRVYEGLECCGLFGERLKAIHYHDGTPNEYFKCDDCKAAVEAAAEEETK